MIGDGIVAEGIREAVSNGSPATLRAIGRALGLGEAEQRALFSEGPPWWAVAGLGIAFGFYAGAYVQKTYPKSVPGLKYRI